jgi:signal transduction histidine kinase
MPERITDAMKQHPDAPGHLVELEILARDGQIRWLQTSVFTIPTDEGDIWAFILRDSTDQKRIAALTIERMQRQSHAQKMEALGSLAGGIAHDFNNTLGGILGAVSLIRTCLDDGDAAAPVDFSRELEVIHQSAQRAASSVRGLMAFAIDTPQKKARFGLDESVRRVAELVSRTMDRSVKVQLADLPTDALITGDAPQIEQLILNLVINAGHAMTIMRPIGAVKGGTITLSLHHEDLDEGSLTSELEALPGRYWILAVADQGVGMDTKTLAKAFDPFFTTKATDQGSGLGLSMVHLIARQHGGFVEVESEPGVGTTFSVYLPAAVTADKALRSS